MASATRAPNGRLARTNPEKIHRRKERHLRAAPLNTVLPRIAKGALRLPRPPLALR